MGDIVLLGDLLLDALQKILDRTDFRGKTIGLKVNSTIPEAFTVYPHPTT